MKAATFCLEIRALSGAISIHAAREGGDLFRGYNKDTKRISIHAAREGGDQVYAKRNQSTEISIHAAREGGDLQHRNAD